MFELIENIDSKIINDKWGSYEVKLNKVSTFNGFAYEIITSNITNLFKTPICKYYSKKGNAIKFFNKLIRN